MVTVVFFLFNVLPGDPARMMLGQNEDQDQLAIVQKKYGFDQPLLTQYGYYLNDLSPLSFHWHSPDHYTSLESGNYTFRHLIKLNNGSWVVKYPFLRRSFTKQGKKVTQILKETLPNTFVLAAASISICLLYTSPSPRDRG